MDFIVEKKRRDKRNKNKMRSSSQKLAIKVGKMKSLPKGSPMKLALALELDMAKKAKTKSLTPKTAKMMKAKIAKYKLAYYNEILAKRVKLAKDEKYAEQNPKNAQWNKQMVQKIKMKVIPKLKNDIKNSAKAA